MLYLCKSYIIFNYQGHCIPQATTNITLSNISLSIRKSALYMLLCFIAIGVYNKNNMGRSLQVQRKLYLELFFSDIIIVGYVK